MTRLLSGSEDGWVVCVQSLNHYKITS